MQAACCCPEAASRCTEAGWSPSGRKHGGVGVWRQLRGSGSAAERAEWRRLCCAAKRRPPAPKLLTAAKCKPGAAKGRARCGGPRKPAKATPAAATKCRRALLRKRSKPAARGCGRSTAKHSAEDPRRSGRRRRGCPEHARVRGWRSCPERCAEHRLRLRDSAKAGGRGARCRGGWCEVAAERRDLPELPPDPLHPRSSDLRRLPKRWLPKGAGWLGRGYCKRLAGEQRRRAGRGAAEEGRC